MIRNYKNYYWWLGVILVAEIKETIIPGCFEIIPKIFHDYRGSFVKVFNESFFKEHGLNVDFKEEYYSVSYKNVLRGLHFQIPPFDHEKIVYCVLGEVMDVAVDLRVDSITYGKHVEIILSNKDGKIVYLPRGIAHGFYVLSDFAIMVYKTSAIYSPNYDSGILWNSVPIDWPNNEPIISIRDSNFESFKNFISPF